MLSIDSEQVSVHFVQLTGRSSLEVRALFAHRASSSDLWHGLVLVCVLFDTVLDQLDRPSAAQQT
jgi:hypothetical protein